MTTTIMVGDCRERLAELAAGSAQTCVTSPPYFGLRDYGVAGQIGLESSVDAYVAELVAVFREVRRVLRDDGTLWLNLGDSYAGSRQGGGDRSYVDGGKRRLAEQRISQGHLTSSVPVGLKPKDLLGIPWRVAFALQADGWYLRSDIIWAKPNPMPESVRDRPTKAHEYVFLLSKQPRYFFDAEAVKEPAKYGRSEWVGNGSAWARSVAADPRDKREKPAVTNVPGDGGTRNIRSVWTIATQPYKEAHFATFPPRLVEPCIKAGTSEKGACAACGAPWWRTVERESMEIMRSNRGLEIGKELGRTQASGTMTKPASSRTTGWEPTCSCEWTKDDGNTYATKPCVALDPFAGAGTVGLVAERLGRDAVLIELNPEYVGMIERRLAADKGKR